MLIDGDHINNAVNARKRQATESLKEHHMNDQERTVLKESLASVKENTDILLSLEKMKINQELLAVKTKAEAEIAALKWSTQAFELETEQLRQEYNQRKIDGERAQMQALKKLNESKTSMLDDFQAMLKSDADLKQAYAKLHQGGIRVDDIARQLHEMYNTLDDII
jgi:hypothetical protein